MSKKIADRVLYEDNHLLIVNKLSGELSQGDHTGDKPLVELAKAYIKQKYNKPGAVFCGLVHRLDRPTSGVIILARTSKALTRMNKLFASREVSKQYYAIVSSRPPVPKQRLVHYLKKDSIKNRVHCIEEPRTDYKQAILSYSLIRNKGDLYLLDIQLETGRAHQIRAQLAHHGLAIVGDVKYGYPKANANASICLHCHEVKFTHPVKKEELIIKAPIPKHSAWKIFSE